MLPLSQMSSCPQCAPVPVPQAGLWPCQREAEAVAGLMQQNMLRVLEWDGRLRDLHTRVQSLRAMVGHGDTTGTLWGHRDWGALCKHRDWGSTIGTQRHGGTIGT